MSGNVASVLAPIPVERVQSTPAIHLRMLGPMQIRRAGKAIELPASRKVRALIAYLALNPEPVTRSHLCELLWDVPNDPRGELRWCLSKSRALLDSPGHRRVHTREETIRLDLTGCLVDVLEVARAADRGIAELPPALQRSLASLFTGDFLEGLEVARNPEFDGWLTAQRRRFRGCHVALLEHLAMNAAGDAALPYLERWRQLAPFDMRVHEVLLASLAKAGRVADAEQHVKATVRAFEADGLDSTPVRKAWQRAKAALEPTALARPASIERSAASIGLVLTAHDGDGSIAGIRSQNGGRGNAAPSPRRASIAVMPFEDRSTVAPERGGVAHALVDDVIARLAKLRSLFVIARGTVFALHERGIGPEEAGRMLDVDYVVGGSVRRVGKRLGVIVELTETRTSRIVWADVYDHGAGDALLILEEIGNRIVASIASEIETIERNRAILKPPDSLDAWEAYHRGLWHMYRFNRSDNDRARHFFETAVRLDPTFARAYAGVSFTHFQNAFQGWTHRDPEIARAFEAAGQSLMADDRDPSAHWAMGRALWLSGEQDQSVTELQCAIDLSPNFAAGHYSLAFGHSQAGDPQAAISAADLSQELSPFDPLLFGMLGAKAMAHVRLGNYAEAANWAVKAAARPNAHPHMVAMAAYSLALAGSLEEARKHGTALRLRVPGYEITHFLNAFRFDETGASAFRAGAARLSAA